uniref:Uncharacterized protein n=1 Tax=Candidatus Kentrum sp. DK TaxID=2126562 RepID=A0A450RTP5_9GAMM|nr:MAG: hypothetical protein BECKDK2373C_GA0170839_100135 [Candidatus Kentron sp. DK]VFJ65221.1 MAG: hypothetical protein BECKDK2373B_GA0170837_11474 [Candidatus Kentron sp. DK]
MTYRNRAPDGGIANRPVTGTMPMGMILTLVFNLPLSSFLLISPFFFYQSLMDAPSPSASLG